MNIKLRALNTRNRKSQGEEIWLVGVMIDNNWYNANELIKNEWLERNNCVGWRNYDLSNDICDNLNFMVPYSDKITLVFERNRWRGICEIEFNGKIIKKDCYSNSDDDLLFVRVK